MNNSAAYVSSNDVIAVVLTPVASLPLAEIEKRKIVYVNSHDTDDSLKIHKDSFIAKPIQLY